MADRALHRGLVEVMTPARALPVDEGAGRGEYIAPGMIEGGAGQLALQRLTETRHGHVRASIDAVRAPARGKPRSHVTHGALRQRRSPILAALPAANDDLATVEIDVLHAQRYTLQNPQPAPVHQRRAELRWVAHAAKDGADFPLRENDGHTARPPRRGDAVDPLEWLRQHGVVQERQRRQRLVLRRRRHAVHGREMRQEGTDSVGAQLARMSPPMMQDVAANP